MARGVEIPITATDRTGQAFQSVQRRMAGLERSAKALRQAAVGFAAIGAAAGASIQRVVAVTDRIGKAAQTAGVSAESLQELRFAFGQLAGTATRDVDLALQRFNRRLGLAQTGTKSYADAFQQLGVSINQDTQPALRAALVSLARIESSSERAATASQIFGEEAGPKIASALSQGIEAVDELAAAISGMITDENVQRAADLNDAMDRLSQQFTAEFANAVLDNGDALLQFATAVGSMAAKVVEAIGALQTFGNRFGAFIQGVRLTDVQVELADTNKEIERLQGLLETRIAAGAGSGDVMRRNLENQIEGLQTESRRLEAQRVAMEAVLNARRARLPELSPGVALPESPTLSRRNGQRGQPGGSSEEEMPGAGTGEVFDEFGAWQAEIDNFYDAWDRGRQIIEDLRTPTEEYAADVQELVDLLAQGGLTSDEFQQALQRMGERFAKEQESGAFPELQNALTQSILAGVEGGADSALEVFAQLLQQMAMQALKSQLSGALANLFPGGGGGGGLFGALGGLFGGARADGGSVTGGKTYLVGERGPELFTAGRTGTITPNDAMGGGFTYAPVVTIQGGASEQDRILFQRQLDAQKAELFDLARRGRL
jgi:hypothetical protein